jgi:hypothetical protein
MRPLDALPNTFSQISGKLALGLNVNNLTKGRCAPFFPRTDLDAGADMLDSRSLFL